MRSAEAGQLTRNIYILAPRDKVTGGIELLHQLGHALNTEDTRAWMICHPFGPAGKVPDAYKRYNVSPVARRDVRPGSTMVIPEIYTGLASEFPSFRVDPANFRGVLGEDASR